MPRIGRWFRIDRTMIGVAAIGLLGCGAPRPGATHATSARRDLLTRDEILSSTAREGDLLQAIRSLRPNFLMLAPSVHSRGSTASSPLAVYIGNVRQAGVEALRTISAMSVAEVRYLDPTASQNAFGPMASGGALVIIMHDESKHPTR